MHFHNRWSLALASGLVLLAACDGTRAPLATLPDAPSAALASGPGGLVAFYSFDQDAGDGRVSPTGVTHLPTGGYEGGAFHFDGAGGHIDLPVDVNPSVRPALTMGAWFRAESIPWDRQAQVLSHDNGGYDRSIDLDDRATDLHGLYLVSAFTGHGVLGSGVLAETSQWHFAAVTYDPSGRITLYVDGQETATTGLPGAGVDFLRVAGNPAGATDTGEPFHGIVDNVFVYDRVLTADEVERIRTGGACAIVSCQQPRRMAFYPFDTGPGDGMRSGATLHSAGGYQGGAYYFDGVDDHIDLPIDINPAKMPRMTMGAWMRTASLPFNRSAQILSHDNGGYDRSIDLDQRALNGWSPLDGRHRVSAFNGNGLVPGSVVNVGAWTFVAAVYEDSTVTLYVDGMRYGSRAWRGEGMPFLRVGNSPSRNEAFHGWIDNVFVVNEALTEQEIAAIRAGGACVLAGTPCNRAPTVQAGGAYATAEGAPVALELAASDPDGDALSITWNLGDGTTGTGAPPAWHTYADNGTYTLTITATDAKGLSATATTTAQIANVRPTVLAFAGDSSLLPGERYGATVSFNDPGADLWTGTVDYGDGSAVQPLAMSGRSAALAHTYAAPGAYIVRVNVRDDDDATAGTATATVIVVSVDDGIMQTADLVAQAFSAGELEPEAARRIYERLNQASTFLGRADTAPTVRQEVAMLNIALRNIDAALMLLSGNGPATVAARRDLLHVRAVVKARLDAIVL